MDSNKNISRMRIGKMFLIALILIISSCKEEKRKEYIIIGNVTIKFRIEQVKHSEGIHQIQILDLTNMEHLEFRNKRINLNIVSDSLEGNLNINIGDVYVFNGDVLFDEGDTIFKAFEIKNSLRGANSE